MDNDRKLTPIEEEEEEESHMGSSPTDDGDGGDASPEKKDNVQRGFDPKTAVRILSVLVLLLLGALLFIRFLHRTSDKENAAYRDLLTTTQLDRSLPEATDEIPRINVNTATALELTLLPGIGEAKAHAIVEYRKENGPLTQPENLLMIRGIGEKILEEIRPYLYFFEDETK